MRNPIHRLPRPWSLVVDWVLTIALAIGFVLAFEAEVAKPYRIPSASMEPTLHCARPARGCQARFSDRVLVLRLAYRFRDPARGDVVVFKAPALAETRCGQVEGGAFVKRIIGVPGDVVSERHGRVLVNGRELQERYVPPLERDVQTKTWARVPRGHYFVMGDNRLDSCDSRTWGAVPRGNLVGPVVLTYWPPARLDVR